MLSILFLLGYENQQRTVAGVYASRTGRKLCRYKVLAGITWALAVYLLLAAVIFSTVLVLVTVISILSAFAKTIKEAQTYVMPVMLVVMGLGIVGMFGGGASQELASYCIPPVQQRPVHDGGCFPLRRCLWAWHVSSPSTATPTATYRYRS